MTSPLSTTLPAAWYHEPAVLVRERAEVFGRSWLFAARRAQLRQPGDYVAVDLAGWPVVVVAQDDGTLAAFHNACCHRAGPLVWDGAGSCGSSLVCRYHGWSYGLDGALRSARDFGAEPEATGLTRVRVDEWRGLVFVNLDPSAPSLRDDLGSFVDECAAFPMEDFTVSHELGDVIAANWKTYADNYLEGYHLPLVHPGLLRQVDAKRYEVTVRDRYCIHTAPARDGSATSGRWLWRYPNLALNVYPGGMNVECYWPVGPGRTRVAYTYLFDPGSDAVERESSMKLSLELLDEDRRICEAVQRNLEAGVYDTGTLSPKHEQGVAAFHELVRAAVGTNWQPPGGECRPGAAS